MALSNLGSGFLNGLSWVVDLDDVAGNIGVTVTGTQNRAGTLFLIAKVFRLPAGTLLSTFGPLDVTPFANQGRQVEFTSGALVNGLPVNIGLDIRANFQPS